MHRISLFFLLVLNLFTITPKQANTDITISAFSYVVMEKDSHRILESRNEYKSRTVASISKLMTAYVALKHGNLDDIFIVGEEIKSAYGSCVYLNMEEEISLKELLYALMLRSGNDAALVIAKNVGGSVELFVDKMNEEANNLRLPNSLFRNPHGLDEYDGGNECSAYAIAILQSYLLDFDAYSEIVSTTKYVSTNHGVWFNKNRLLKMYEYTTGGKTGFTVKAKRTLVTSARKDNLDLIVVTINCGNDFNLHKALYQKYFNIYEARILLTKGENKIDKYTIIVPKDLKWYLPKNDWNNATILYKINEKELKITVNLILNDENIYLDEYKILRINEPEVKLSLWQKIVRFFKRWWQ